MPKTWSCPRRPSPLIGWLQAGVAGAASPQGVLERFAALLMSGGVRAHRVHVFVRTLHPDLLGPAFGLRETANAPALPL